MASMRSFRGVKMRKHRRPDWRNLPPKKMIRSRGWVQTGERQYKIDLRYAGVDLAQSGTDVTRLIIRGFMGNLDYKVVDLTPLHEHVFTAKPTLSMEIEDVPVSFALYNQLIVREPENSYMGVNVDA